MLGVCQGGGGVLRSIDLNLAVSLECLLGNVVSYVQHVWAVSPFFCFLERYSSSLGFLRRQMHVQMLYVLSAAHFCARTLDLWLSECDHRWHLCLFCIFRVYFWVEPVRGLSPGPGLHAG